MLSRDRSNLTLVDYDDSDVGMDKHSVSPWLFLREWKNLWYTTGLNRVGRRRMCSAISAELS